MRTISVLTPVSIALSIAAWGQPLPVAAHPEDAGFSSERLGRIRQVFNAQVEKGTIPGAVLLVARNGKVVEFEAAGFQDRAKKIPMSTSSIFRIFSMTKPVTSVAIMMLAEEGKVDIGAPVAQYLPEFREVRVGVEKPGGFTLEAPKRPMTVQDLLRHTSGLTYGLFGNSPVDELYKKANLFTSKSLAEMVAGIAKLPLAHQPGEVWEYSLSTDVLGRIVEVVSGMELDQFFAERITKPLRMSDTAFYLNEAKAGRMAFPDRGAAAVTRRPPVLSGGGGLLSTAGDYARFCQMLLNGGELDGVRLLSPKTVALMTSDHLTPAVSRDSPVARLLPDFAPRLEAGQGFGLGFTVRTAAGRSPMPGSVGDYSWAGIMGTFFWVDPQEKLLAVLMVQIPQEQNPIEWRLTRELVYQAMIR